MSNFAEKQAGVLSTVSMAQRYTDAFREKVIAESCRDGATVVSTAAQYRIDAQALRRWRRAKGIPNNDSIKYSEELKAKVLEETAQPGAHFSNIAKKYGVNIPMVTQWRLRAGLGLKYANGPFTDSTHIVVGEKADKLRHLFGLAHGAEVQLDIAKRLSADMLLNMIEETDDGATRDLLIREVSNRIV